MMLHSKMDSTYVIVPEYKGLLCRISVGINYPNLPTTALYTDNSFHRTNTPYPGPPSIYQSSLQ